MPGRRLSILVAATMVIGLVLPGPAAAVQPGCFAPRPDESGHCQPIRRCPWAGPERNGAGLRRLLSGSSGAYFYPEYVTEFDPRSGGRVGVPSYQWGYFGARPGPTWVRHTGYYGTYVQWSRRRGY
jgi:hypothetical protein